MRARPCAGRLPTRHVDVHEDQVEAGAVHGSQREGAVAHNLHLCCGHHALQHLQKDGGAGAREEALQAGCARTCVPLVAGRLLLCQQTKSGRLPAIPEERSLHERPCNHQ